MDQVNYFDEMCAWARKDCNAEFLLSQDVLTGRWFLSYEIDGVDLGRVFTFPVDSPKDARKVTAAIFITGWLVGWHDKMIKDLAIKDLS